jgi:hypothetical protein
VIVVVAAGLSAAQAARLASDGLAWPHDEPVLPSVGDGLVGDGGHSSA